MKTLSRLWTVDDVSEYLGVPIATLYQWRHHRTGPRSRKVGRHLRYLPEDVESWVREQE
ncbi:helix-turn-helix domain-containing protein [Acrocarpospora sp. B8E8]|uniref:helix-turn-helix transcriptional regulator n=1 Tax=Acrocarpospora sp. B8E8 TaxID=3153572 RepID=UPI00325D5651